ncbi:MAG TPA: TetR/AcrR family transcriptional regulator, partial [Chthoniobacterales bacterium]
TKELLILEVFARRLEPVNRRRLSALNALETEANGAPLPLEKILDAFIRPAIENDENQEHHHSFLQLMSRCLQEPSDELHAFVKRQFDELATRFNTAILRSLPGLVFGDLFWQMSFLCGGLHHTLAVWARFDSYPVVGWEGERPERPHREALIRSLVASAAAGMRASSSNRPDPSSL